MMKKYLGFFRASMQICLQYKFDFFMWIIYGALQILLYFFLWRAIFENKASLHGFTLQDMISYITLATIVQLFQPVWQWGEIAHSVHNGDIIFELLRPYNILFRYYFTEMGARIFNFCITGLPFLVISIFILKLQGPASFVYLGAAIISLFFATVISFSIWTFVGLTAFFLTRVWGVYTTVDGLMLFLTGMLIPLDFMPDWLKTTLNTLPFKDIIYTPISIYMGRVSINSLWQTIGIQAFWCIIFLTCLQIYYRQSLKKIVIQGG